MSWTADDYANIRDNVTGLRLDPAKVLAARTEELEFMDKLGVMTEVPLGQCWLETNAKPVGTKWVDINKGDDDRVEVRSRLVAMELKSQQVRAGISRDDVFSATPPLEAVRLLLIMMMTEKKVARKYKFTFIRRHDDWYMWRWRRSEPDQVGAVCSASQCTARGMPQRTSLS